MSKFPEFDKAQKIVYKKLSKEEWEQNKGRLALVEMDKEDFFIGDEFHPPIQKATEKYPDSIFLTIRLGFDVTYTTGASPKPITIK